MMGAEVVLDRAGLTVSGGDGISGIDVDLHDASELTPVVAALCALADSPSVIRGVAHIRGHETDRLAALRTELNGLGAEVDETDDGLRITPRPLHGGHLPHLRRPPHGHGRRGARAGRARRRRRGRRHRRQDDAGVHPAVGPQMLTDRVAAGA